MGEQVRFSAPIERSGNGAYVTVPFDAEAVFGKKRSPCTPPSTGSLTAAQPQHVRLHQEYGKGRKA